MGILKDAFERFKKGEIKEDQLLALIEEFDISFETTLLIFPVSSELSMKQDKKTAESLIKKVFSAIRGWTAKTSMESVFDRPRIIRSVNATLIKAIKNKAEQIVYIVAGTGKFQDFKIIFKNNNESEEIFSYPPELYELFSNILKEMIGDENLHREGSALKGRFQIKIGEISVDFVLEFYDNIKKITATPVKPTGELTVPSYIE